MRPGRNLKSYLLRLRRASLSELIYRLNQEILLLRMKKAFRAQRWPIRLPPLDRVPIDRLRVPSFVFQLEEGVVQKILEGMVFSLNGDPRFLERFEEDWRGKFFADIPGEEKELDIRMVWEPGRLQHITILLLLAHRSTDREKTAPLRDFAKDALLRWIRANPFLCGPHYLSPLECALRLPVFFYALKILEDLSAGEREEILRAAYLHAWWVARNLSRYSSRGNHTIGECIGLVFAGALFQETEGGKAWLSQGLSILREELFRQILDDGGPAEQSIGYHRFILDLYWLALNFLKKNGIDRYGEFQPRLMAGETFWESFQDGDAPPAIGDSDDGWAVAPGIHPLRGRED